MAKSAKCRRITLETIEEWPAPIPIAISEEILADYERKREAIHLYASGASLNEIKARFGISRQYLYYLIERCQLTDEDGREVGFFALIPGRHLNRNRRSSPNKLDAPKPISGALQALFGRYSSLRNIMHSVIVDGRHPTAKRRKYRLTWTEIHDIFLDECEKLGLSAPNYPFNSDSKGSVALQRWGRRERELKDQKTRLAEMLSAIDDPWRRPNDPPKFCFERVECDGHYVDVNWIVETPGLNGEGVVRVNVSRIWLIALLETKSTATLGYSVAIGQNYSAADVARAIHNSLKPWKPRSLSISTVSYKPGECLPNAFDPKLAYVCYDELHLDNAKSNLSQLFLSVLERTVNAVPVFGPAGAPNARPHIEMLFDLLEEAGIHPLPSTTGANPKDQRRSRDKASAFTISLQLLLDLIDLLIVRYNACLCPGTSLTRLEILRRAATRETNILRRIPLRDRERCLRFDLYDVAKIGIERGRPILRWRNARYSGPGLVCKAGLVGREVLIMANSLDVRKIEVSVLNEGISLGVLEVERRWRQTPHSLITRNQIRKHMSADGFLKNAADLPRAVRQELERSSNLRSSRKRRDLARMIYEQELNAKEGNDLIGGPQHVAPACCAQFGQTCPTEELEPIEDSESDFDAIIKSLGTTYR